MAANFNPTRFQRLMMLNESGDVTRLHTVTTLKNWSIGRHVYGAQCVAMELCDANMIEPGLCLQILLYHDTPEMFTGDVPAPTKRRSPIVAKVLDEMEEDFYKRWRVEHVPGGWLRKQGRGVAGPTQLEYGICKVADALDLGVCVLNERMLGNRHPTLQRVLDNICDYIEEFKWVTGAYELRAALINEWQKY